MLFLALVVVGGAGWYVYNHVLPGLSIGSLHPKAEDYAGPGTGSVEVKVNPGDSGTAIGETLVEAGVVKSVKAFTNAYSANVNAAGIQPGVYTVRKEMKAADAVALLASNNGRVEYQVTIPEGYTADQAITRASSVTGISPAQFAKAKKNTKATGLPAVAKGNYEGWLYPATYSFDPDVTATEILNQMIAQTKAELKKLKVASADQEDVLIKASIVEREASRDADFGKVARVIDNRLAPNGPTGGRLQIDATVAYGLGRSGLTITSADQQDASNPYNSYKHAGLPPGPISNPGVKAIKAVLNPTPGNWVFYVTVNLDTGETKFTDNYQVFGQYKKEFQAWLAQHPQSSK